MMIILDLDFFFHIPTKAMAADEPTTTHHPLEHEWSMYLHYPMYGEKYSAKAFQHVGSFATVENFWCYLYCLPVPSDVFTNADGRRGKIDGRILEAMGIFKVGIQPKWEDPVNQMGGHWECRQAFPAEELDELWFRVQLALIGETLESGHEITGARIVDKSRHQKAEYRLEVWTKTLDMTLNQEIADNLQKISPGTEFVWKQHSDAITAWKV